MTTSRWRTLAAAALLLIPLALILLRVLSWVRFGVDYPYADDWRALMDRELGVFDLGIFFTAANDTLYPVGRALDWAAHVLLGSNAVVYQAVTQVAVLTAVLGLQFVLLRRVLVSPPLAAAVAVLTILGLRAGESYWGVSSLGYGQALPVVFLLGILVLATGRHGGRALVFTIALLLALAAGFSYISGAFAALAAGLALLVGGWFIHTDLRTRILAAGAGAVVGGAISSVAQLASTISGENGSSLTMPWDLDVWRFMLGVLADSLLLPVGRPVLSFALIVAVVLVAVAFGVVLALRVVRGRAGQRETILAVTYLSLGVAVLAYLGLLAMGRLDYLRGGDGGIDAFALGWDRFYQWWPTVFWPWLAAAGLFYIREPMRERASAQGGLVVAAGVAAVALAVVALATNAYDYDDRHRGLAQKRDAIARCVSQTLASSEPVMCQAGRNWDLAGALLYADHIETAFSQDLQLAPASGGVVLGRLSSDTGAFEPGPSSTVTAGADGLEVSGSARHAWRFTPADEAGLAACQVLEVRADVRAEGAESTLVRYRPLGDGAGANPRQKARNLARSEDVQSVSVTVLSEEGFAAPLTILPAVGSKDYTLDDLAVICHRGDGSATE